MTYVTIARPINGSENGEPRRYLPGEVVDASGWRDPARFFALGWARPASDEEISKATEPTVTKAATKTTSRR